MARVSKERGCCVRISRYSTAIILPIIASSGSSELLCFPFWLRCQFLLPGPALALVLVNCTGPQSAPFRIKLALQRSGRIKQTCVATVCGASWHFRGGFRRPEQWLSSRLSPGLRHSKGSAGASFLVWGASLGSRKLLLVRIAPFVRSFAEATGELEAKAAKAFLADVCSRGVIAGPGMML